MHKFVTGSILTLSLIAMAAPAQAAWRGYISHELGFSFEAPGEVKSQLGTYRAQIAGPRQTIVFRSVDNNIEYKVTVMKFAQAQADGADLIGERVFAYEGTSSNEGVHDESRVLMDTFARVEPGSDPPLDAPKVSFGSRTIAGARWPPSISPKASCIRSKPLSCPPMATTRRPMPAGSWIRSRSIWPAQTKARPN